MSYSSSREAAFRLRRVESFPSAFRRGCGPCVGWSRSWLELSVLMRHSSSRRSMKRRGVVTLRAAGRHAHSEGREGAARRFEGARLGRRAAVAISDGALGLEGPPTRHQQCWLHKTLNVLDKLPKSMLPNAYKDLRGSGCRRAGQRARRGQRRWHGPGSGSRGTHVSALFHDETGRPWHGNSPSADQSSKPMAGIVGSAARAPWSRCPLH